MLAVLVAVGLAVFLFTRLDDEIRRQVQQTLAKQFPQYNISVGGARLVEGEGIAIYDLAISETASTQLQNNLLVVDEIMLVCDSQLTELMKGTPEDAPGSDSASAAMGRQVERRALEPCFALAAARMWQEESRRWWLKMRSSRLPIQAAVG